MALWIFGLLCMIVWFIAGLFLLICEEARKKDSESPSLNAKAGASRFIRNLSRVLTVASVACFMIIWLSGIGLIPGEVVIGIFRALSWTRREVGSVSGWVSFGYLVALTGSLIAFAASEGARGRFLGSKGVLNTMSGVSKKLSTLGTALLVPSLIGILTAASFQQALANPAVEAMVSLSEKRFEQDLTSLGEPRTQLSESERNDIHTVAAHIHLQIEREEGWRVPNHDFVAEYRARANEARRRILADAVVPGETRFVSPPEDKTDFDRLVAMSDGDDPEDGPKPPPGGGEPGPDSPGGPAKPSPNMGGGSDGAADPIEEALERKACSDTDFRGRLAKMGADARAELSTATSIDGRITSLLSEIVENRLASLIGETPAGILSGLGESMGLWERVEQLVEKDREASIRWYKRQKAKADIAASAIAEGKSIDESIALAKGGIIADTATVTNIEEMDGIVSDAIAEANQLRPNEKMGRPGIEPVVPIDPAKGSGTYRYTEMFPSSEEALHDTPEYRELQGQASEENLHSEIGDLVQAAGNFLSLMGSSEVGGVLIGRLPEGADNLDVGGFKWEEDPQQPSRIRLGLVDTQGQVHWSTYHPKELVYRALEYAADGRPVAFTKPLVDRNYRIDLPHPALAGSPLARDLDRLDVFTDEFTARSPFRTSAEDFVAIEGWLLRAASLSKVTSDAEFEEVLGKLEDYVQAVPEEWLQPMRDLMQNPGIVESDQRSFLFGKGKAGDAVNLYGADLVGNIEDNAVPMPENAGRRELAKALRSLLTKIHQVYATERQAAMQLVPPGTDLQDIPKRIKSWVLGAGILARPESGVREIPFSVSYDSLLMTDNEPPMDLRFMLNVVFDGQPNNPNPFEFPLIKDQLDSAVRQSVASNDETFGGKKDSDVFREAREFTILQRLFRTALAGRLGYDFPVEQLPVLARQLSKPS
ncbi:MAG TPA: hypothetical protein VHE55_09500 [Fimbriimonadaceae bacterium]|nr:hypothetical protein [Fimbriimonadaceae bacterium]